MPTVESRYFLRFTGHPQAHGAQQLWRQPVHGDHEHLCYGKPAGKRPLADNSGTFSSGYGNFNIQQIGITVTGCYGRDGLIQNGGFDGRVLRFT